MVVGLSGCTPRWHSELASVNAAGTDSGNGHSFGPMLSPDGTKVAFTSYASDLGPTDTNGFEDVYVRDLTTGVTSLVSVDHTGTDAGERPSFPTIFSPDSSALLFFSASTNLTSPGPTVSASHLYLRDLAAGTTTLVSGDVGNNGAARFSPDGSKVLWTSGSTDVIYETDLGTGDVREVAHGSIGIYSPTGDTVGYLHDQEIWLHDMQTGTTTLVSDGLPGTTFGAPFFSHDGTKVAFVREVNAQYVTTDIYVHDRVAGTIELATAAQAGVGGSDNDGSMIYGFHPSDRNQLLFSGRASNLVANDTDRTDDVFVRDLARDVTTLVSVDGAGTGSGNGRSTRAAWVGDGSKIAFVSGARNLGVTDTNGWVDVYLRDMTTDTNVLVSINAAGDNGGNGRSGEYLRWNYASWYELSVSDDGSLIAFGSDANDLGPTDSDDPPRHDIYVASTSEPPT